jgi:hypothetical protein
LSLKVFLTLTLSLLSYPIVSPFIIYLTLRFF